VGPSAVLDVCIRKLLVLFLSIGPRNLKSVQYRADQTLVSRIRSLFGAITLPFVNRGVEMG
jgi:hypothetical protein